MYARDKKLGVAELTHDVKSKACTGRSVERKNTRLLVVTLLFYVTEMLDHRPILENMGSSTTKRVHEKVLLCNKHNNFHF